MLRMILLVICFLLWTPFDAAPINFKKLGILNVPPSANTPKANQQCDVPIKARPQSSSSSSSSISKVSTIAKPSSPGVSSKASSLVAGSYPPQPKFAPVKPGAGTAILQTAPKNAVKVKSLFSTPLGLIGTRAEKIKTPASLGVSQSQPSISELPEKPAVSSASSSAGLKADRSDLPEVRSFTRGSKRLAAEAFEDRENAMAEFQKDKHAASSLGSRDSLWNTWCDFHRKWFADEEYLPLDVHKLDALGAVFKKGKNRAVANYFSRAVDEHVSNQFPWTDFLQRAKRLAIRSATRGMGPPRQSQPLPLEEIALELSRDGQKGDALRDLDSKAIGSLPLGMVTMFMLASLFMMREIEAAFITVKHVTINYTLKMVTFNLPTSKTDPKAYGKHRTWKCTCTDPVEDGEYPKVPCAYHYAVICLQRNKEVAETKFGADLTPEVWESLHLFFDKEMKGVSKEDVVEAVNSIAEALGETTVTEEGKNRFGGHSMRVSGARWLGSIGVEIAKIMIFARWVSMVVLRYVEETPILTLSEQVRSLVDKSGLDKTLRMFETQVRSMRAEADDHAKLIKEISEKIDNSTGLDNHKEKWVRNDQSGAIHCVLLMGAEIEAKWWKCRCGWKFGMRSYTLLDPKVAKSSLKKKSACDLCFPEFEDEDDS